MAQAKPDEKRGNHLALAFNIFLSSYSLSGAEKELTVLFDNLARTDCKLLGLFVEEGTILGSSHWIETSRRKGPVRLVEEITQECERVIHQSAVDVA